MTPAFVKMRLRQEGLGAHAEDDRLVEWICRVMQDMVDLARTQARNEDRITATEVRQAERLFGLDDRNGKAH